MKKGAADKIARIVGDVTGIRVVLDRVFDMTDGTIDRLVAYARKKGVPERKIAAALRAHHNYEKAQSIAALLMPAIPNPVVLRKIAGRPHPSKAKKHA